ncbi:hypothetical protein LRP88_07362 [Fusarium phalaenopsidis]
MKHVDLLIYASVPAALAVARPCNPGSSGQDHGEVPAEPDPSYTAYHQPTNPLPVSTDEPSYGNDGEPVGQVHYGELTYYDVGLGACGEDHAGQDESVSIVALSAGLMGRQGNGNPYCGRTITLKANGATATAVVKDKCEGCAFNDIDVSKKVFKSLWGSLVPGRTPVEWYFND